MQTTMLAVFFLVSRVFGSDLSHQQTQRHLSTVQGSFPNQGFSPSAAWPPDQNHHQEISQDYAESNPRIITRVIKVSYPILHPVYIDRPYPVNINRPVPVYITKPVYVPVLQLPGGSFNHDSSGSGQIAGYSPENNQNPAVAHRRADRGTIPR